MVHNGSQKEKHRTIVWPCQGVAPCNIIKKSGSEPATKTKVLLHGSDINSDNSQDTLQVVSHPHSAALGVVYDPDHIQHFLLVIHRLSTFPIEHGY